MSSGAWLMAGVFAVMVGCLAFLGYSMARSIRDGRDRERSLWREYGLTLALMILFVATWIGHGVAEWQVFTDEERARGATPQLGDFVGQFAQSTLENWQSEFLQLFSFVVLAALYIHKGSGESKDGTEKIEASLRRIEAQLGTLPSSAPAERGREWELPETPLHLQDTAVSAE